MASALTPLQQSLRQWITDQLPSIPSPKPDTLRALTQGQAAEELFDYLTTRVRTVEQTAVIRALLALHEPIDENTGELISKYRNHDEQEADVHSLRAQVLEAEQRLSRLQNLAFEKCGPRRVPEKQYIGTSGMFAISGAMGIGNTKVAARNALTENVQAARDAVGNATIALQALCEAIKVEPTNTTSRLHAAIEMTAAIALDDPPNTDELEMDIESLTPHSDPSILAATLLEALRDSVRLRAAAGVLANNTDLQTDMIDDSSVMATVVESARDTVQDAQLRIGSAWRNKCLAVEAAEKRIKENQGELTGRTGEIRVCVAELEAERAVLTFATKIQDSIPDYINVTNKCNVNLECDQEKEDKESNSERYIMDLRTQREASVALAEQRVRDLQMAAVQLATGSASQLGTVRASAQTAAQDASKVTNHITQAIRTGRRRAGAIEHALRAIDIYPNTMLTFRHSQYDSESQPGVEEARPSLDGDESDKNSFSSKDDNEKKRGNGSQGDVVMGLRAVRKADVEIWALECSRIALGLSNRANVAVENRARGLRRVDEQIVQTVSQALSAAQQCREKEAVQAQQEMRNWATEPGRQATRWIFKADE